MQLKQLIPVISFDVAVEKITFDSRQVDSGAIFVAIKGASVDGHSFIDEVLRKNPALVVVDREWLKNSAIQSSKLYPVENTRRELERLACAFYGYPAEKLFAVGVTGTNGKTSITYMVEAVLNELEAPTGVIGTVNHHLGSTVWPSELTTPDALTLQKRLSEFIGLGAKAVAFEVSSHALSQNRVGSVAFDALIFTNLTRDHLDYHKTMDDYFLAKEKLFFELPQKVKTTKVKPPVAIINFSDSYGPKIRLAPGVKRISYGEVPSDFQFKILKSNFSGIVYELRAFNKNYELESPLVGRHNIYNSVAALAAGVVYGGTIDRCHAGLKDFLGVPGRLQKVKHSHKFHVFIDYAHTDDALVSVLAALGDVRLSQNLKNKIIVVFGCGGDRDKGKRPLMLKAALEGADHIVVTSDNPRTEDPEAIIGDILAGVGQTEKSRISVEVDRRKAIEKAISMAKNDDVVLIAGKGHEDYQIIGTQKLPFSDYAVAETILNGL